MATVCPSSDGYLQQCNTPCHNAQIILDWLLEQDRVLKCFQMAYLEHLCNVVERDIPIVDVQPTVVRLPSDDVVPMRPKSQRNVFSALLDAMKNSGNSK